MSIIASGVAAPTSLARGDGVTRPSREVYDQPALLPANEDPSRARRLLGECPKENLETCLARLIDDVRELGPGAFAASEAR